MYFGNFLFVFSFMLVCFPVNVVCYNVYNSGMPVQIGFSCDDKFTLYVNNTILLSGSDWRFINTTTIYLRPGDVIAVLGQETGRNYNNFLIMFNGGLVGAVGGYLTSTSTWKCTTNLSTNWNMNSFNDSKWPAASGYDNFPNGIWGA